MQNTIEALNAAYLAALKENPAHHPVVISIADALKKTGVRNVAQHIANLKSTAVSVQIQNAKPTGRTNRQGRNLVRFDPAAAPAHAAMAEAPTKKPAARLKQPGEPLASTPIQVNQPKSQPPQSTQEAGAAADGDDHEFVMPKHDQLLEMTVPAMAKTYTKEQLIQISVNIGLLEVDVQEKSPRQIAGMIKKELGA